jgi:alanyl-tRNA synthetase
MNAEDIRETFLSFFESKDHRRLPSGSLVPASYDPSVLLTTAGMQPLKPYFSGAEPAPYPRLTSCQKCFRTTDIENVGLTARHLTFFEMLGNFSIGDYFKQGAVEYALELSEKLGFDQRDIWVTVFGGDDELGIGCDEQAIACWRAVGMPDERIVHLGRKDNFWQSGSVGPCGPCSELYLDRGPQFGGPDDLPGDDTERFLEYWNLVFMQFELHEDGSVTDLPKQSIDTGLGLDRLAAILQDVSSVFETDVFRPLIDLGEELSGATYGDDFTATRALRILADHGRAMTFLLADGVVPSIEERGYILRRIMRRTLQQGRVLGIERAFLPELTDRVIDLMADAYPELSRESQTIKQWAASEEKSFGRTLIQGERLLSEAIEQARAQDSVHIDAEQAFLLHDTYGFPFELTKELVALEGLSVDQQGFDRLMGEARERARSGARREESVKPRQQAEGFAREAGFQSRFVGYETTDNETVLAALQSSDGRYLAKLVDSPFYAEGGGQVSDSGFLTTESGAARVTDVYRLGSDQALVLEPASGELKSGEKAHATVDRELRLATMCNHTATHLLHAALRNQLGPQVRQAGSYVGPDKLRFDFTYGQGLSAKELATLEEQINAWIVANLPVHGIYMSRSEAEAMGAIALFGEKYGEWVRVVEIDGVSRELCGGTHVRSTAEIGLLWLVGESSSASNVRRIEAVTGMEAVRLLRGYGHKLQDAASTLKVSPEELVETVSSLDKRAKELSRRPRQGDRASADALVAKASDVGGIALVAEVVEVSDADALLELSDRVKQMLGDSAVVLGSISDGRVHLVANITDTAARRGLNADSVAKQAGKVVGGGGGGRETMAQAGGRDPEKLGEAIDAARVSIQQALS